MNPHGLPNYRQPFEGQFEPLEDRLVFSASPLAVPLGPHVEAAVELAPQTSGSNSGQAAGDTASDYARSQYGLDGLGQTVVIIDSGIAYDHYALGGGLGSSYRVVGGWDFAENDADPYDDGAAGFHGTHVAGIVGSSDAEYTGLAPGVDLVGLRVFDDQGNSSFDWIESALAWVHNHRDAFDSPITTVNMSIGADWNANEIPDWTNMEDELELLIDDGIFISVSAGNNFSQSQSVGLNYPAASPHVIPVGSVGATGDLSAFSQRNQRILAAPGENITSTAPDYLYGFDGVTDDFVSASGTSMSAPYVAGASALLRQAMEAMGHSQIDQSDIDNVFRATADRVYDPVTAATYDRIDLQAALDSVVGNDDYGSTADSAYALAPSENLFALSGTISSTSDEDHFTYVAEESGELEIEMLWHSAAEHRPTLVVEGEADGAQRHLDVVAGQTYSFSIESGNGIGRYGASLHFTAVTPQTPRSAAAASAATATRTRWEAPSTGTFELAIAIDNADQATRLEIRNQQNQIVGAADQPSSNEAFTITATAGERFEIDVLGGGAITWVATELNASPSGGSPGLQTNTISVATSFQQDSVRAVPVDDVLLDFATLEERPPTEVDEAILGWQRFSNWLEGVAHGVSDRVASEPDEDETTGVENGSLEIYCLTLDEAFSDAECWRR
jgi:hypothetical protein